MSFQIVRDVSIEDKPVYPYRGILLDTARNYYTIDSIKKTIGELSSCNPVSSFIYGLETTLRDMWRGEGVFFSLLVLQINYDRSCVSAPQWIKVYAAGHS